MKKNLVRLITIVTIMAFFLFGCGKTQVVTTTEEPKEEAVEAETQTDLQQPEAEKEEVKEVEEQTENQEQEVVEEVKEESELEYIYDDISIDDYMKSLEPKKPVVVIYNEEEGYKIKLRDGQKYFMRNNDRIFLSDFEGIAKYVISLPFKDNSIEYGDYASEIIPDLPEIDSSKVYYYGFSLDESPDDFIWFSYQIVPPTD